MYRRPGPRLLPFERAVLATVRRRSLFTPDDIVLAATSGGADSTALLSALSVLRAQGELAGLHALHVDHGLREGGAADGEACLAVADQLGVPCASVRVSVRRGGDRQAAARSARYSALVMEAARTGAGRIATGHHRGDQAETVVHRLLRGSGARGLAGIPPRNGALVRPLIDRSRREVVAYLGELGLPWREDPTNAGRAYTRNRLRLDLLPLLEAEVPGLEARLCRTADLLRQDDEALEELASQLVPEGAGRVALTALRRTPPAVRGRAVRRVWRNVAGHRDLGARHVEALLSLCAEPGHGPVALPGRLSARVEGGWLVLSDGPSSPKR